MITHHVLWPPLARPVRFNHLSSPRTRLAVAGADARCPKHLSAAPLRDLARRAPSIDDASADDRRFWQEVLAQAGLGEPPAPDADSTELVARAAAIWPPPFNRSRAAWRLARLINRTAGGRLMRGQIVLDWRSHVASWLISTQKSAPDGGGYWEADTADAQLAETAYGMLCFLEL